MSQKENTNKEKEGNNVSKLINKLGLENIIMIVVLIFGFILMFLITK
ncbi:MAG: hypothetical protein IKP66_05005 [Lachnospiraceae bacterium]|nr:hypothetical protein [Lachnospiraceae bacterium]